MKKYKQEIMTMIVFVIYAMSLNMTSGIFERLLVIIIAGLVLFLIQVYFKRKFLSKEELIEKWNKYRNECGSRQIFVSDIIKNGIFLVSSAARARKPNHFCKK